LEGRTASDRSGKNYAPRLFTDEPEAETAKTGEKALAAAMRRLFKDGRIRAIDAGKAGHKVHRLVVERAKKTTETDDT